MSASVGLGTLSRRLATLMIWPDWQYPHCGTSSSIHARCTGCVTSGERPSIVVTALPCTLATLVMQERAATPLTCTVHAPHRDMPQPNFVPVMPSVSRKTHNSGISGVTSTSCGFPFSVNLIAIREPPLRESQTVTPIVVQFAADGVVSLYSITGRAGGVCGD